VDGIDKILSGGATGGSSLSIGRFVRDRDFRFSERTVKRDLALFKKLGREAEVFYIGGEERTYARRYAKGVKPLFVDNLPNQGDKADEQR
jgi:hypothetical protein